ncbi:MAG: hypothetical protein ACLRWQ_08190 [Flavonifractor plautii]
MHSSALALAGLGLAAQSPAAAAQATPPDDFRAVWVATGVPPGLPPTPGYHRPGGLKRPSRTRFCRAAWTWA